MTRAQLNRDFWNRLGLFYHPRLRLMLTRHIYGAINKPIHSFPGLEAKMASILTELLAMQDVHELIQLEAIKNSQALARLTSNLEAITSVATPQEVLKAVEALVYVLSHQLPFPLQATQLEAEQLHLIERPPKRPAE